MTDHVTPFSLPPPPYVSPDYHFPYFKKHTETGSHVRAMMTVIELQNPGVSFVENRRPHLPVSAFAPAASLDSLVSFVSRSTLGDVDEPFESDKSVFALTAKPFHSRFQTQTPRVPKPVATGAGLDTLVQNKQPFRRATSRPSPSGAHASTVVQETPRNDKQKSKQFAKHYTGGQRGQAPTTNATR